MPILKINHVVSFSSEDSTHTAENLLNPDPAKKWKCSTPGEKSATVVLQLEKASKISGIDIGNEHSAYIEVLVSRSGASDFKVLLVMSSFMNPMESRQSTGINKVRMFNQEQLSKPVCDEKWDLIKIVCTQPFNKHVQYGLSFITFHTPEVADSSGDNPQTLGNFTMRQPSPDDITVGSLFARRNQLKENEAPPTAAVAIRQSSETTKNGSPLNKQKTKFTVTRDKTKSPQTSSNDNKVLPSRNRDELLYSDDEVKPNKKIDKIIEMKKNETDTKKKLKEEEEVKTDKKKKKKKETDTSTKNKDRPLTSESTKRKSSTTPTTPKKKVKINRPTRPFHQLLEGVVLVISGIQNPDRADLRTAALSMGAKYKADWDNTCTHLICAFPNTPKFNQVRGKGKIVTRKWIEDCVAQRKRLPWRRYALDKNDQGKNESEDEIWERTEEGEDPPQQSNSNDNIDDEPQREVGSDTEEEIARIQRQKREEEEEEEEEEDKKNDPFEAETDHDSENSRIYDQEFPDALPTYFNEKAFHVDDDSFEPKEGETLKRYIFAYKGNVYDFVDKSIDFVITKNPKKYADSLCVSPEWIWACHNAQEMLPPDDYTVT